MDFKKAEHFQLPTSIGHLHPILIKVGSSPGGAPTDVDLIGGVDPHATAEPVHKQEIGILEVSHIFSLFIRIFDLMLVFLLLANLMLVHVSCFYPSRLIGVVKAPGTLLVQS